MNIDREKLPQAAMIDTNVFIRFLGQKQDAATAPCKAFCDAMIESSRLIFVAAPTLAEMIRQQGKQPPRVRGIIVVPFDAAAAALLGANMQLAKMHETKTATGLSLSYLKYDSMIVACALRAGVEALVTRDAGIGAMATGLKISICTPESFEKSKGQLELSAMPAAPASSSPAPAATPAVVTSGTVNEVAATSPPATEDVIAKADSKGDTVTPGAKTPDAESANKVSSPEPEPASAAAPVAPPSDVAAPPNEPVASAKSAPPPPPDLR